MNTLPPTPTRRCSVCSAEIPTDAPQALCPKCLLLGVASEVEAPDSELDTRYSPGASPGASRHGRDADGRAPAPSVEQLAPAFPQLQIIELIGRGGMGFVYKAKQPKLDRFVALKILPGHLADEPSFHERFEREARVLAKLQHPAIVSVYDFGDAVGVLRPESPTSKPVPESHREESEPSRRVPESPQRFFYLLLEYVDGVNLREAMRAGKFTPEQALAIVPQVCEALQYAHSKGVLHRDIKPENILLNTEGHVKIADFGIAKVLDPEIDAAIEKSLSRQISESERAVTRLTATGSVLGTPLYMAPEQLLQPNAVDHRADIFSLGVVFYEMLTGELPMGRFAPPSEKSLVDRRIDEVVMRALAKERELRQQSADEMKTEVESIASHDHKKGKDVSRLMRAHREMPASAGTSSFAARDFPWFRRFFWLAACLTGFIMIPPILIFIALLVPYLQKQQQPAPGVMHQAQVPQTRIIQPPLPSMPAEMTRTPDQPARFGAEDPFTSHIGLPPMMGAAAMPPGEFNPNPIEPAKIQPASPTAAEAQRLGLIEVAKVNTEARVHQQPIRLEGIIGQEVQIEPHFSALVQLPNTTNQLWYTMTTDQFRGQLSRHSSFAPFPCDYVACDWSSGKDFPNLLGYIMSPGAYDFRGDSEVSKVLKNFNASDRSAIAGLALQLTKGSGEKIAAVAEDWQKATHGTHLRFRFVPKFISQLDVPDECLVELQKDFRTIFTREGGLFTKYSIASTESMKPILDAISTVENREERAAEARRNPEKTTIDPFANKDPDAPAEEVVQPIGNMLLDFTAKWAGPCQKMSPIIARLQRQNFPIRTVDIDVEQSLARQFKIESIPCYVVVVNGREVSRISGVTEESELRRLLETLPR